MLGITGIQSIVLSGLWMVLCGLLWMVGKCLHQCRVDSQLLFLSFHVLFYPSFLPSSSTINKGGIVEKSNKELAIEYIRDKGGIVEKTNKELAIEHECEGMCVKVCYF